MSERLLRLLVSQSLLVEDRAAAGSAGQKQAGDAFVKAIPEVNGYESIGRGSQAPDLKLTLEDGSTVQAENKNSSKGDEATVFDHTIHNEDEPEADLDSIADAIIKELGPTFVVPPDSHHGVYKLMNGTYDGERIGKYYGEEDADAPSPTVVNVLDKSGWTVAGIDGFYGQPSESVAGPISTTVEILGVVGGSQLDPPRPEKPGALDAVKESWQERKLRGVKTNTRNKGVYYAVPAGKGPVKKGDGQLWMRDGDGNYYAFNKTDVAGALVVSGDLEGQTVDLTGSNIRRKSSPAGLSYRRLLPKASTSSAVIAAAFDVIVKHLTDGGDELFVISGPAGVYAWGVGGDKVVGDFPIGSLTPAAIKSVKLSNYGTPSKEGGMRMGVDVKFDMGTATKIVAAQASAVPEPGAEEPEEIEVSPLQESLVRQLIRRLISDQQLLESTGKKPNDGDIYEETLVDTINNDPGSLFRAEMMRGTYDFQMWRRADEPELGVSPKADRIANVEVKLDWKAQMGAVNKKVLDSFTYSPSSGFSATIKNGVDPTWAAVLAGEDGQGTEEGCLFEILNSNSTVRKMMNAYVQAIRNVASERDIGWGGEIDLLRTFEQQLVATDFDTKKERRLAGFDDFIVWNDACSIPVTVPGPEGEEKIIPQKQVCSGDVVVIPGETKVLQWEEKDVNYLIVGTAPKMSAKSKVDPAVFQGYIGRIGQGNPLGLIDMPAIELSQALQVEVRWKDTGNKSHTFQIGTRLGAGDWKRGEDLEVKTERSITGGVHFASVADLNTHCPVESCGIPTSSEDVYSQPDAFAGDDPEEISSEEIYTETSFRSLLRDMILDETAEFRPAQQSPRAVALRLLEEHGLEPAMNMAIRDGDFDVLKILMDFGPDSASQVTHFPFGRM